MNDLTKEITPVDLWADALESDEYKQGMLTLQGKSGSFCCLGVACKVYEKATGNELPKIEGRIVGTKLAGSYSCVSDWLGLIYPAGSMDKAQSLMGMNDSGDFDFKEIAAVIRSRPEGLFRD